MSYRSDRARRRASRTRGMRILAIILIVLLLAIIGYIVYLQLAGQDSSGQLPAFLAYLRTPAGSPIFSYSTRPSLEMPSMIFSGVALEKFNRIVL
jgi:hypothetical protein